MAKTDPYFSPATFKFLRELAKNNSRDWFMANKARYEAQVRGPCLRLIADLAEPLKRISPQIVASAKPVGGSLFRIHRDTRFSSDKTPYKTHAGMTFHHAATKATARGEAGNAAMGRLDGPVFYLHLQPGDCFAGGGIWHPAPATLKRIRDYMLSNPASWKKVTTDRKFLKLYTLGGEALSRPPRGYDPAHELIEDLKRKDIVASAPIDQDTLFRPDLVKQLIARYQVMAPLIDWLCGSLDLDF